MKIERNFNEKEYIKEITGKEFQDSGMLWFVNTILHQFGMAILYDHNKDTISPAICRFRGFAEQNNDEGYKKVTDYLRDNIIEIERDFEIEE